MGFGDPVTSPLILAKFAMLPAFVSLFLYRVKIYHFSITVLGQDKTFTVPCRFDINVGTQTRKLPILVRGSAIPVLVPVLVQAAPYSIIY